MAERAALIEAILKKPSDDTLRLQFADWLDANKQPERAEFIRVQCEAAKLPGDNAEKSKPAKRAAALLAQHEKDWRAALGVSSDNGQYVRGFLKNVRVQVADFVPKAVPMLAQEPMLITLVLFWALRGDAPVPVRWVDKLAANPALRAVTAMSSHQGKWGANRFARFIGSPYLRNLRSLEIIDDVIGLPGVKNLVAASENFRLELLNLKGSLQDKSLLRTENLELKSLIETVTLLATAPRLGWLKELALPCNGLGENCIKVLAASRTLPERLKLDVSDNPYDAAAFNPKLEERFNRSEMVVEANPQ